MFRLMFSTLAAATFLFHATASQAVEEPTAGKQVEQSFKIDDSTSVPYLMYLPKDYEQGKGSKPLILFLHGRGESNGPLSLVAQWGPPRFAKRGDDLSYIVVSPQCPREDFWSSETQQERVMKLLDSIVENYDVDESRIYLTGLSMGGFGSWALAASHPSRFAAVAPVCGKGDPATAGILKSIPIWAFHGDQDTAVPFQHSVDMVEAIKKAGGEKVRFTTFEHIGHNCWSATYATPELYHWFDRHSTDGE